MSNTMLLVIVCALALAAASALFVIRRRLTIKHKLLVLSLSIGLGAIAVTGGIAVYQSHHAILEQEEHALEAIRTARQAQLGDYLHFIHQQVVDFSRNGMIIEAT